MRKGGAKKPSPAFLRAAARTASTTPVSEALLRQARKSGQLNLSNRSLEVVPSTVWRINADPPPDATASFAAQGGENWWDQVDLVKLILAANQIKEIPEDIRLLTALTILDIHSNQLSTLPNAIGELQQLNKLVLSHNELTSLPSTLITLTNLQLLKLDHNKLSNLPEDLGCLIHLEELDVSHNLLSKLPTSIRDLNSLHRLAATHNQLESVPSELSLLAELIQVSLSNNKLSSLPDLSDAGSLQVLYCNYNLLSELPVLKQGSGLKELHFGFNRVRHIHPDRLTRLQSLIYLDLRDNSIAVIPECIVDITTLERLDLTNNDLTGLPYVMGNMENLKSLLLEGNPFKSLRREIIQKGTIAILKYLKNRIQLEDTPEPVHHSTKFTPTKLGSNPQAPLAEKLEKALDFSLEGKSIDISKKNLTEIPLDLYSNVQVTTLNVSFNRLKSLSPQISVFTALSILDLRNNLVGDLPPELVQCSKLRDIVLSFNAFQRLPEVIYSLKSIETIVANDNQIASIDVDGLLQLPHMGCLDLQNNSISQVPPRLGTVTTLKQLQLGGNPFRIPRAAILAKGTAAILDYLKDRIPT